MKYAKQIAAEAEQQIEAIISMRWGETWHGDVHEAVKQVVQSAIEKATAGYAQRLSNLQKVQSEMRDPERQWVCDIIANGYRDPVIEKSRAAHASEIPEIRSGEWVGLAGILKKGDHVEFTSDKQTDKGPCTGRVSWVLNGLVCMHVSDGWLHMMEKDMEVVRVTKAARTGLPLWVLA